ncbi:heme biosynthesis HemY N-terminal domain-containing protein [Ancylobacter dichloromethanicus]
MIRLVVYLLVLSVVAFGIAWLADRPGAVIIDWQGWQIETSVLVAASALLALLAAAILIWTLLRLIVRSPDLIAFTWRSRRRNRGWSAVTRGLVAVGSGDAVGARRAANDAQRLLGEEPLSRLLAAQAAQLSGDAAGAEEVFRSMTETPRHAAARPARPACGSPPPRRPGRRAAGGGRGRAARAGPRLGGRRGDRGALPQGRFRRRAGHAGAGIGAWGAGPRHPPAPARGAAGGAGAVA